MLVKGNLTKIAGLQLAMDLEGQRKAAMRSNEWPARRAWSARLVMMRDANESQSRLLPLLLESDIRKGVDGDSGGHHGRTGNWPT